MSTQFKNYFFLLLLFWYHPTFGQQSLSKFFSPFYPIDIIAQSNAYPIDAIPSMDGGLLITGYVMTKEEGEQAFVARINKDGGVELKKTIGRMDQDRGQGITEDNRGRLIVVGNSKDQENNIKSWLMLMTRNGEIVWEKKLNKGYSFSEAVVKNVFFDKQESQIICFGVRNNSLWVERHSTDRTPNPIGTNIIKSELKGLEIIKDQSFSVLYYRDHYYVYCAVNYGKDELKKPLVVKVDSEGKYVDHAAISDNPIEATGAIVELDNNYFGMIGTTLSPDNITPKEDVFLLKINKDLDKTNRAYPYQYKVINFQEKRYHHSNDFGIALLPISGDSILLAANTRSHKPGANKESISFFYVDEKGYTIDEKPEIVGKHRTEQVTKMVPMPGNAIWVVGQQETRKNHQVFVGLIQPPASKNQLIDTSFFEANGQLIFNQQKKEGHFIVNLLDSSSPKTITGLKIIATSEDQELIDFYMSEIPIAQFNPGEPLDVTVPFKLNRSPRQNSKQVVWLKIINDAGEVLKTLQLSIPLQKETIPELLTKEEIVATKQKENQTELVLKATWNEEFPDDALLVRAKEYELSVTVFSKDALQQDHFFILHNGKMIQPSGTKMDEVTFNSSEKNIFKFKSTIELDNGINQLSVLVNNGIQVDTTKKIVIDFVPADESILWVCSIGIEDKTGTAAFTQKDALNFATIFDEQANFIYDKKIQKIIIEQEATTAERIVSVINKFSEQAVEGQIQENDIFLLFISGHGFMDSNSGIESFKIKGSNYDPTNKKYTSFDFRLDVLNILETIHCKKLVLLDACRSGGISLDMSRMNLTNTGILTSCDIDESSYEIQAWENGAFTKVLTDLLSNPINCRALDRNGDQALTLEEIFSPVKERVSEIIYKERGVQQTPSRYISSNLKNIPFFYFRLD